MARFENNTSEQGLFLAIQLNEQFGEDSKEARLKQFLSDSVNLNDFRDAYRNDHSGRTVKNPTDMIAAILYGYIMGIRSSREIERMLQSHLGFMYVSNRMMADHSVICEFKIVFRKQIEDLFYKLLFIMNELGAIDWEVVVGDGTKIKAYANKGLNVGRKKTDLLLRTYRKMAEKIIQRDLELEANLKDGKIAGKEYVTEKKRISRQQRVYESVLGKINEYQRNVEDLKVNAEEHYNLTDPDSKLIPSGGHDHFIQGYNMVLMVSNNDVIVDYRTSTKAEKLHTGEMISDVENLKRQMGAGRKSTKYLMDAGFQDMETILRLEAEGHKMYVATKEKDFTDKSQKRKNFEFIRRENGYCLECRNGLRSEGGYDSKNKKYSFFFRRKKCAGCPHISECYRNIKETTQQKTVVFTEFELSHRSEIDAYLNKMNSKEGKKIYSRRFGKEHVNANVKTQKNYHQTYYRGMEKVENEHCWLALSHNFMKYAQYAV
jgi:transposase